MRGEYEAWHNRLIGWAEIFDDCDFDVKKMIACALIDKVCVSEGYQIRVELTLSVKPYMEIGGLECGTAA